MCFGSRHLSQPATHAQRTAIPSFRVFSKPPQEYQVHRNVSRSRRYVAGSGDTSGGIASRHHQAVQGANGLNIDSEPRPEDIARG